jgi:hypothetical protein
VGVDAGGGEWKPCAPACLVQPLTDDGHQVAITLTVALAELLEAWNGFETGLCDQAEYSPDLTGDQWGSVSLFVGPPQ